MRLPGTRRGLYPKITANTLHQWRCDELLAANNMEDILLSGEDLVESSGGADAGLNDGPAGSSRDFTAGTAYYHGATTGDDAAAFQTGDFLCHILTRPEDDGSGYSGNGCTLIAYEGAITTAQFFLGLTTSNEVRVGNSTSEVVSAAVVETGQNTLVSIRAVENTTYVYEVYFNGIYVGETSAIAAPTGGTTCVWKVAESNGVPSVFIGEIGFIHVEDATATSASIREHRRRLGLEGFDTFTDAKFEVKNDALAWIDLADLEGENWIRSISCDDDVDNLAETFQVQCLKSIDRLSLSFLRTDSKVNNTDVLDPSAYEALIRGGRHARIHFAQIPLFLTPESTDWHQYLEGEIDIVSPVGEVVAITGRDKGAELSREWVEEEEWYDNTRTPATASTSTAETMIQQIVTDHVTSAPTLRTPVASGAIVRDWMQQTMSVHSAINAIAAIRVWDVRYRWAPQQAAVELVFSGADREQTAFDYVLDKQDYFSIDDLKSDRSSVRNKIKAGYYDYTDLDGDGNPKKKFVTREDTVSQGKYGIVFMSALAKSTSQLDTVAEATAWADYMLSDLSEPDLDAAVTIGFRYNLDIGDRVSCGPEYDAFDNAQPISITSKTIEWSRDGATLSFRGRGKPVGGRDRWLDLFTMPGDTPPVVVAPVFPLSTEFTLSDTPAGFTLDWPKANRTSQEDWRTIEVHASTAGSGFTPSASTLIAKQQDGPVIVSNLLPGETYSVKIIRVGVDDVQSSAVSIGDKIAKKIGGDYIDPVGRQNRSQLLLGGDFNSVTRGDGAVGTYEPDFWRANATGVWNTNTLIDTTKARTGRHTLRLLATGGATGAGIVSQVIPVKKSGYLRYLQDWEADNVTSTAKAQVRIFWWTDSDATVAASTASDTLFDVAAGTINTPEELVNFVQAPSNALYATIEIDLDNATYGSTWNAYFDRIELEEVVSAYFVNDTTTSGGQVFSNATWTKVEFNNAVHNRLGDFDLSNEYYTCPTQGLYSFSGAVDFASWHTAESFIQLRIYHSVAIGGVNYFYGGTHWKPSGQSQNGAAIAMQAMEFPAGTQVWLEMYHTNGSGTVTIPGGRTHTWFSGMKDE